MHRRVKSKGPMDVVPESCTTKTQASLRALISDQVKRLRDYYYVPTINLETASYVEMQTMLVPMPDSRESNSGHILVPAKLRNYIL